MLQLLILKMECVQLAWQLHDSKGNVVSNHSYLIRPENFNIPFESEQIHGISLNLLKQLELV